MIAFVLLALAAVTADTEEQAWINQLRQADRLRDEGRYDEAEGAYIAAPKQAEQRFTDVQVHTFLPVRRRADET